MAKADLPKTEDWREVVGRAIDRTRTLAGLSLKEFAGEVGRDERQVGRWINGEERPQFDVLFARARLRCALVVALAELGGAQVEVETVVRVKRSA